MYFKLKGSDADFSDNFQAFLGKIFLEQLEKKGLNCFSLERLCYMINDLLFSKNLLLRVFEKRKKKYLIKKSPTKNEVKGKLSSCVEERFNGFQAVRHLFAKEEKRKSVPLDIVYKPIKSKSNSTKKSSAISPMRYV